MIGQYTKLNYVSFYQKHITKNKIFKKLEIKPTKYVQDLNLKNTTERIFKIPK